MKEAVAAGHAAASAAAYSGGDCRAACGTRCQARTPVYRIQPGTVFGREAYIYAHRLASSEIDATLVVVLPSQDYLGFLWDFLLWGVVTAVFLAILGVAMAYQPVSLDHGHRRRAARVDDFDGVARGAVGARRPLRHLEELGVRVVRL